MFPKLKNRRRRAKKSEKAHWILAQISDLSVRLERLDFVAGRRLKDGVLHAAQIIDRKAGG